MRMTCAKTPVAPNHSSAIRQSRIIVLSVRFCNCGMTDAHLYYVVHNGSHDFGCNELNKHIIQVNSMNVLKSLTTAIRYAMRKKYNETEELNSH